MACIRSSCPNYYRNADEVCERCDEFEQEKRREADHYLQCKSCQKVMLAGAFNTHSWQHYWREGERSRSQRVNR